MVFNQDEDKELQFSDSFVQSAMNLRESPTGTPAGEFSDSFIASLQNVAERDDTLQRERRAQAFIQTVEVAKNIQNKDKEEQEDFNFVRAVQGTAPTAASQILEGAQTLGAIIAPNIVPETEASRQFKVGTGFGLAEGIDNTLDLVARGVNYVFDADIDIPDVRPLLEEQIASDPESFAQQIGEGVGQVGSAFIPGTIAVKTLRVPSLVSNLVSRAGASAVTTQRISSIVAAEGALVFGEQFAFDPEDPILSNLIQQYPELQNPLTEYLATDPTDSEAMNRFRLAAEGLGLSAVLTPVFEVVGRGLSKAVAQNPNLVRQADRELTGLGDSDRAKQLLFEEYLLDRGYPAEEVIGRVRGTEGNIDEIIEGSTDRTVAEVLAEVRGNPEALQRVLARNLLEGNSDIGDAALIASNVRNWQGSDSLEQVIENLGGRPSADYFSSATSPTRPVARQVDPQADPEINRILTGFERFRAQTIRSNVVIDKIGRRTIGFGAEPRELRKAFDNSIEVRHQDNRDLANSFVVLADQLTNTVNSRSRAFLEEGNRFTPALPPRLDDMFAQPEVTGAKSIGNIFKDRAFNIDQARDFLKYIADERSAILDSRGIPNVLSGDPERGARIAAGRNNPEFQAIVPEYAEWTYSNLRYAQRSGLLSAEDVGRILDASKRDDGQSFYIPFFVDTNTDVAVASGKRSKGKGLKGIKGNIELPLQDGLEAIAQHAYTTVQKSEVNRFKQEFYRVVDRMHASTRAEDREFIGRVAERAKPEDVLRDKEFRKQIEQTVRARLSDDLGSLDQADIPAELADLTIEELLQRLPSVDQVSFRGDSYDVVYRDGKPELYRVLDKDLQNYVEFLGASNAKDLDNFVTERLKKVNKIFGEAITKEWSFLTVAALRDTISAAINSPFAFKPFGTSISGFTSSLVQRENYREMLLAGATGSTRSETIPKRIEDFGKLRPGEGKKQFSRLAQKNLAKRIATLGWEGYKEMATRIEMAARVGEYNLARKHGMSPELSAFFANEVSTNFMKRGMNRAFGTYADHTVFLNASLQGIDKTFRSIAHNKGKVALGVMAYATIDYSASQLSELFEEYELVDDDTRALHTVFPNPANFDEFVDWAAAGFPKDKRPALDEDIPFYIIPTSHEYGGFMKTLNAGIEQVVNEDARGGIMDALGRFYTNASGALGLPTLLAPVYQHATNENAFGNEIVPAQYDVDRNLEMVYRGNTNNFAIYLSDLSKKVDGLMRDGEGEAKFSPLVAEHYVNAYTPGVFNYVSNALDIVARDPDLGPTPDAPKGKRPKDLNPVVYFSDASDARFTLGQSELREGLRVLFELKSVAEDIKTTEKNFAKRVTTELFEREVVSPTGEKIALHKLFPTINVHTRLVAVNNSAQEAIAKDPALSASEKADRIADLQREQNKVLVRFLHHVRNMDPENDLKKITGRK